MFWVEIVVISAVGIVALMAVILARRPAGASELGSVSHHWIAAHHMDAP